ncbi:MAG: type II secretion system inner membrane protein GspF [Myxococcota bacterium]|nr:type II secretion system inner membrane protein GspF [Myxococcota bacterium]
MPVYAYKGVNASGRSTKGFVDAESERIAQTRLRRDGIYLTEIAESAKRGAAPAQTKSSSPTVSFDFLRRISGTDLAIATRQLATLIGAGIPLIEALSALGEQVENSRLKGVIGSVRDRVNEGASLADAMEASGPFEDLYISMVRAGEAGGALEQVLERLADYLESSVRTKNKVVSILLYPAMMFLVAVGVVIVMVTVVLPQITQLLTSLDRPLPFYTVAVINGSNFMREWWWAIVALLGLGFVGFRILVRNEAGRRRFDAFRLRVPVFGKVIRQLAIARFTRTLSTLLAGGIPIVRSLDISKHVAANVVIADAIETAKDSITEGSTVAAPLRASGHFPPLVTHMVDVGERSGELEPMLAKVADTYDEQVENSVTRMTALLEPVLILVMVGIVMVIIMSTLVPLLELTSAIQ